MSLHLKYKGKTSVPVEIEGLVPNVVREMSLAEVRQFTIHHGNQTVPLAEFFDVKGDPADGRMQFEGDLTGVHWIGTGMTGGEIHIAGNAGRHVGAEMDGGKIQVEGNAGGWVGAEMHGGLIHVRGNSGHLAGAAYRGSSLGMTGGTILIDGNAGNEVGLTMRRGMIAVGGDCGDAVGFNMIAGSIFVFGTCGIRPGAGMRRGTIGLLGPKPPTLLPTFRHACRYDTPALQLIFKSLKAHGFAVNDEAIKAPLDLYHGDFIEGGRGEVIMRASG